MIFTETELPGAFVVEPEPVLDQRGSFARIWSADEFRDHGLNPNLSQCSVSFNHKTGTIRGMHWQAAPHEEAKLIRCTRGRMRDIIVDLRTQSPTFGKWLAIELEPTVGRMVYIPEGFAHGFETLQDETDVGYQISTPFIPEAARGFRWNDPAFAIEWMTCAPILSERDRSFHDFGMPVRPGPSRNGPSTSSSSPAILTER